MGKNKLSFIKLTDDISDINCRDKYDKDPDGLQDFLCNKAVHMQKNHLSGTYIIEYDKKHIGYITSSIGVKNIDENKWPKIKDGKIFPAFIIQNFAIDKLYRGKGIGKHVLIWCNGIGRKISEILGCRYIVLYANKSQDFYLKNGFCLSEEEKYSDNKKYKLMYKDIFPENK